MSILFVCFGKYCLGSKLVLVRNYDPNDFYTEIMITRFSLSSKKSCFFFLCVSTIQKLNTKQTFFLVWAVLFFFWNLVLLNIFFIFKFYRNPLIYVLLLCRLPFLVVKHVAIIFWFLCFQYKLCEYHKVIRWIEVEWTQVTWTLHMRNVWNNSCNLLLKKVDWMRTKNIFVLI